MYRTHLKLVITGLIFLSIQWKSVKEFSKYVKGLCEITSQLTQSKFYTINQCNNKTVLIFILVVTSSSPYFMIQWHFQIIISLWTNNIFPIYKDKKDKKLDDFWFRLYSVSLLCFQ